MLDLTPYEEEIFSSATPLGNKTSVVVSGSVKGIKLYNPTVTATYDGKTILVQTVQLVKDKEPITHIYIDGIITETQPPQPIKEEPAKRIKKI